MDGVNIRTFNKSSRSSSALIHQYNEPGRLEIFTVLFFNVIILTLNEKNTSHPFLLRHFLSRYSNAGIAAFFADWLRGTSLDVRGDLWIGFCLMR